VGYNNETADKFFFYTFIAVLLSMCGWAYGILAGSAFSEPKVAVGVAPMFILPVMLFGGFF
jgi:ATP-binding cassette subfamily G (WHITE) protein 2